MVEIPEGYTELELVGFTDKGSYADGTSYVKNDLVHYGDSIYKCIVDNTVDVLPSNTSCWKVFILNHSNLDSIMAVDTEGKLGAKGEEVSAQQLVDKISKGTNQMVGATEESDGIGGIIPPPRAGDEDKALLGNGTWGKVDSIYKYKTKEEYDQAVANGEIPDGATVIKEWDEDLSVIPVDSEMSGESLNPLQNKVITQKITEINQSIEELNTLLNGIDETLSRKLDVSKIANNLVTTEEGYALDARMGKALGDRRYKILTFPIIINEVIDHEKNYMDFSFNVKVGDIFTWTLLTTAESGAFSIDIEGSVSGKLAIDAKNNIKFNNADEVIRFKAINDETIRMRSYVNTPTTIRLCCVTICRII